ncbi:hypothetical protein LCE44_28230 [Vibrio harveyi]|uniref:hypothetical protein n=1 Tax=Vibrio harveyi TaxID=669 RepID=UPI000A7AF3E5|nr:hypothetical protein [Vibrio harveyi]
MKLPVRKRAPSQTDCNSTGEGRNENREIKESRKQSMRWRDRSSTKDGHLQREISDKYFIVGSLAITRPVT